MSYKNARVTRLAIVNNTTDWETIEQAGANHEVTAEINELVRTPEVQPIETPGQGQLKQMKTTAYNVNPTLTFEVIRSGALWVPVACLFGSEAVVVNGANDDHTFTWLNEARSYFGMVGIIPDNDPPIAGDDLLEWVSLKPTAIEFTKKANGILQMSVETIGNNILVTGDSGIVHTADDFTSVTFVDSANYVCANDQEFLINAQGGGALASPTDRLELQDFTLRFARPISRRPLARGTSGLHLESAEPLQNEGYPDITLGFNLDRYNAIGDFNAFAQMKATMQFLGATNNDITFSWAALEQTVGNAPLTGGNGIPYEFQYRALETASNPTGFSHSHVRILLKDQFATSYLLL